MLDQPNPVASPRAHLLLLPGHLCDARQWRHQIEHLSAVADVACADLTRDDSMAAMAERALDAAPPRFAIAGLSMGGYVAFEILRRTPERVTKVALLDTSHRPDPADLRQRRDEHIARCRTGRFSEVIERMLPTMVHPSRLGDAQLVGEIRDMAMSHGPDVFMRQQRAMIRRADAMPLLAQIAVPTLVLCGRTDPFSPELHAEMAAAIPRSRLAVIEECGHMTTMERPGEVTRLLREWVLEC